VQLGEHRNITTDSNGRNQKKKWERSRRLPRVNAQRLIAQFSSVTPAKQSKFRLAWDANFRALLQLSVRSRIEHG
jgi:hypothetical protein